MDAEMLKKIAKAVNGDGVLANEECVDLPRIIELTGLDPPTVMAGLDLLEKHGIIEQTEKEECRYFTTD